MIPKDLPFREKVLVRSTNQAKLVVDIIQANNCFGNCNCLNHKTAEEVFKICR